MTATRTDVHRPSAPEFDPENYECVDVFDLRPEWGDGGRRTMAIAELAREGYTRGGVHPLGQCSHCGAWLRYTALMLHHPTKTYLWIGEQCLTNRFEDMTADRFRELRKTSALHRERMRKADRIAALIDAHPLLAELTYPQASDEYGNFVRDIAWKLQRDGELSERQISAVEAAILREVGWRVRDEQRAAQRAAELATATPAPSGRVRVTGTVLSVKWVDNDFGGATKMLLHAVEGYRVWVSIPSNLEAGVNKGDCVAVTATLAPKKTAPGEEVDPYFAIGSRPVKGEIIAVPQLAS